MIGVDEDLDWGGLISDSDSEGDGVVVNTDISPDASLEDLTMPIDSGRKGITDISPDGSEEDETEATTRRAEVENRKKKKSFPESEEKQNGSSSSRKLRSHLTMANIDDIVDERSTSPVVSKGRDQKKNSKRTILHSESAPPTNRDVQFKSTADNSRARSPISRALSNKVGVDPGMSTVDRIAGDGRWAERNARSPQTPASLSKVTPLVEEARSPTSVSSPPSGTRPNNQGSPGPILDSGAALQIDISKKMWNQLSFRFKPQFTKFTEVHSFANAVKVIPAPEGAKVLCATADSTVRLIDATSGRVLSMFEGHSDRVLAVAVSEFFGPGDKGEEGVPQVVVAGSRDETVCIWDYKSSRCRHILSKHEGAVWAVAVTTHLSRPMAVSGSSDCSIRSWDIETGAEINVFRGHSDTVLSLAIHVGSEDDPQDPPRVVSGGADHMVRVWDLLSGRHCRMLEGHTDDVNAVCLVVDPSNTIYRGVKIVSGGRDRSVRVWDMERGVQLAEFHGHTDCVYGVAGIVGRFTSLQVTDKDQPSAAVAKGTKNGVGELNRKSSVWIKPEDGGLSKSATASFLVVSCGEDRTTRVWDVLEQRQLVLSNEHKGSVKGISLDAVRMLTSEGVVGSAMLMATCSWDKSVLFYDFDEFLRRDQKKSCCVVS